MARDSNSHNFKHRPQQHQQRSGFEALSAGVPNIGHSEVGLAWHVCLAVSQLLPSQRARSFLGCFVGAAAAAGERAYSRVCKSKELGGDRSSRY